MAAKGEEEIDDEEEQVTDLSNPDVTTKYQTAAGIINKALQAVIDACKDGADIGDVCEIGDKFIEAETDKLYNKKVKGKKIEKGIGSPTCVSVNEFGGYFSPLKGESRALKAGDVAKIDMACQIDGFVAAAGHTIIVGDEEVSDRRADVIKAAWTGAEAALRLVQVGNKSKAVTAMFQKCADEFKVQPVQDVMSCQMKKHVIHGNNTIVMKESPEDKVEEFTFEQNEVYCINVAMSTGEGKVRPSELRSTVFKRAVETNYVLKTQKARQFISDINKRFPALPFSLRAFEDETMAKVGVSEAKRHDLLHEYPVSREREGEFIAHFQYTVLLLPGGTKKVTGLPLGSLEKQAASKCEVQDEELKKLLATSANPKKQKKAKKEEKKEDKA